MKYYALDPTVAAGRFPPSIFFCFAVLSFSPKEGFADANCAQKIILPNVLLQQESTPHTAGVVYKSMTVCEAKNI